MSEREAIQRLVAMLLGLARLAEYASQRSLPIRLLVLWILRPAEPYARSLVMHAARDFGCEALLPSTFVNETAPMLLGTHGNSANIALRLAVTFEILAALLNDLAELASRKRRPLASVDLREFLAALNRHVVLSLRNKQLRFPVADQSFSYNDTS